MKTLREFFETLARSQLLSRQQFTMAHSLALHSDSELDSEMASGLLVDRGFITKWQAERLLEGFTGFHVGKYRLTDQIGQGGMGAVFKAQHAVMDRTVALKVLSKARLENKNAIKRFHREVKAAAALDHQNIIVAHDAGQVGDTHYLVMEFVEGRDLNAWIKKYGKINPLWASEFIRQAALGLKHANDQGMVHRDIKPANLLVNWEDPEDLPVIKILDMGLARFTSEQEEFELEGNANNYPISDNLDSNLTQAGQILGTPDYLAPEQIEKTSDVDIRSDIFSLGCTFFKLLTGQLPYGGSNVMEKLQARISETAPPPVSVKSLMPELPEGLSRIVAKMISRSPKNRFQTPEEVVEALEPYSLYGQKMGIRPPEETSANGSGFTVNQEVPVAMVPPKSQFEESTPDEDDNDTKVFLNILSTEQGATQNSSEVNDMMQESFSPPPHMPKPANGNIPVAQMVSPKVSAQSPSAHASRAQQLREKRKQAKSRVLGIALGVIAISVIFIIGVWIGSQNNGSNNVTNENTSQPDNETEVETSPPLNSFPELNGENVNNGGPDQRPPRGRPRPNIKSYESILQFNGHSRPIRSLDLSQSGDLLLSASEDGYANIWNLKTQTRAARFPSPLSKLTYAKFFPNQSHIVLGKENGGIALVDIKSSETEERMKYHTEPISLLGIDSSRKLIVSGSNDGRLAIWDYSNPPITNPEGKYDLRKQGSRLLAWGSTPKGPLVVYGGKVGVGGCMNPQNGYNFLNYNQMEDSEYTVTIRLTAAAFSSDGKYLAVASTEGSSPSSPGRVTIWDIENREERSRFGGHGGNITCVAFSSDGKFVATGSNDGTIRIWQIGEFGEYGRIELNQTPNAILFPDEKHIISATERIRVWEEK